MDEYISIFFVGIWVYFEIFKEWSLGFYVICRFSDIEPEIILDWEGIQLTLWCHFWVYFFLDHAESLGHPVQDGGIEDIYSCVDMIANKFLWFFYKFINSSWLFLMDNNSKSGGVFYFGKQDGSFFSMTFVVF